MEVGKLDFNNSLLHCSNAPKFRSLQFLDLTCPGRGNW